jgi:hypothetical protein
MLYILVESKPAEVLLIKLLQEELQAGSVNLQSFKEPSSLYGGARALLVMRHKAVAVVLDADSTYPVAAARRRQSAEEVIGEAAWAAPLRILLAVPTMEALLFRRPDAVARAYGPVSESLLELGRISPRNALEKLDPDLARHKASFKIIQELDTADIAALRNEPPVRELLEFLGELRPDSAVAAATVGS